MIPPQEERNCTAIPNSHNRFFTGAHESLSARTTFVFSPVYSVSLLYDRKSEATYLVNQTLHGIKPNLLSRKFRPENGKVTFCRTKKVAAEQYRKSWKV